LWTPEAFPNPSLVVSVALPLMCRWTIYELIKPLEVLMKRYLGVVAQYPSHGTTSLSSSAMLIP
jgi:hypothetical protein